MSEVRKIKTLYELDEVLPFILQLRKKSGSFFPVTGFIGWLANSFFLPTTLVLGVYDEGKAIGYAIAAIENSYGSLECCVVDAYMDEKDNGATVAGLEMIIEWSHSLGVRKLVCYTMIGDIVQKRYGFQPERTRMVKEI